MHISPLGVAIALDELSVLHPGGIERRDQLQGRGSEGDPVVGDQAQAESAAGEGQVERVADIAIDLAAHDCRFLGKDGVEVEAVGLHMKAGAFDVDRDDGHQEQKEHPQGDGQPGGQERGAVDEERVEEAGVPGDEMFRSSFHRELAA